MSFVYICNFILNILLNGFFVYYGEKHKAAMKAKMKKKNMCKKHQINKYRKCFICGKQYGENLDAHMHSYVHHEAIEHLKGCEQLHKCWACDVSVMGLELYKKHISTRKHTQRLYKLHETKRRSSRQANYNIKLTDEEFTALEQHQNLQKYTETCIVCCKSFPVQDLDVHMHSVVHHRAVEKLKGSPQVHKCWACNMIKTGMAQFEQHVGTLYHKYMLFELQKISADGETVDYSADVDDELRALCDQKYQQNKEKKSERRRRWREAKWQRAKLERTKPAITNEEFTNDHLPQSCHFFLSWENQNDHPAAIQLNQNMPKRRQESILDMDGSNGPLVKRPCLEKPSENLPQEMPANGTQTPEIEGGGSAGSTCDSGLIQRRMKDNKLSKPNRAGKRACSTQKETTENEAVIPKPPLQKLTRSKKSTQKVKKEPLHSEQDTTREDMNGQEPCAESLPLAEMIESQTSGHDCQAEEMVKNVQPRTVRAKRKKSNECETEQGETSLENSLETNSCNAQKNKKKKKQDVSQSNLNPKTNDKTSRKRKVNKLLTLSSKEDELTSSLENVGDELFEAYSTLQSAYTEVQHLLAVKQQVTSEMASLRAKRIKILQDMKNPTVELNAS